VGVDPDAESEVDAAAATWGCAGLDGSSKGAAASGACATLQPPTYGVHTCLRSSSSSGVTGEANVTGTDKKWQTMKKRAMRNEGERIV